MEPGVSALGASHHRLTACAGSEESMGTLSKGAEEVHARGSDGSGLAADLASVLGL